MEEVEFEVVGVVDEDPVHDKEQEVAVASNDSSSENK